MYAMRHKRRAHARRKRFTQRTNGVAVREVIAELNNLWHAAEMLPQCDHTAERSFREVINRSLPVVKVTIRNALQVSGNEPLHLIHTLAHGIGRDLLFIADHDMLAPEIQRCERGHIALTSFINNNHVELCISWVKALVYAVQGHDPNRYRMACRREKLPRLSQ